MVGEEVIIGALDVLPSELANSINVLIQAIGGLLAIYIIIAIIRMYSLRKQFRMIQQIKADVSKIKRKLKI